MQLCQEYSVRSFGFFTLEDKTKCNSQIPLPWVLESLTTLCIDAIENPNCATNKQDDSRYNKMYNAIWNNYIKYMLQAGECISKFFIPVSGLIQLEIQQKPLIKYYRYNYFFTYKNDSLDVQELFLSKFGSPYQDYLFFSAFVMRLFDIKLERTKTKELINRLRKSKYGLVMTHLTVTRAEYITELKSMTNNSEDIFRKIYCVSPSYKYAFITDNSEIFFPLPHLLPQSVTSSFLYRLTEKNDRLRAKIGKHVQEDYLLKIVRESNVYDDVCGEIKYIKNRTESFSPDVMALIGDEYLYLEIKTSVPYKDIRFFDQEAFEKTVSRYVGYIIQLYKQVIATPTLLNPFPDALPIDKNRIWGAVVLHGDSRIIEKELYQRVNSALNFDDNSEEAKWIKTHIKVIGLYDVEWYCFASMNLIDGIKSSFLNMGKTHIKNQDVLSFREYLENGISEVLDELKGMSKT